MDFKYRGYEIIAKKAGQTKELTRLYDFILEHPQVTPNKLIKEHGFNKRVYSRLKWLEKLNLITIHPFEKTIVPIMMWLDIKEDIL